MKFFGLKPTSTTAAPPSVQFVPGDMFFMRRIALPPGTDIAEVPGFVELQFEELSPFPLDQVHHGFVRASDGSAVFVYAAYRRRLAGGMAESWPGALFVLPDFAPALKLRFAASTVVLFRSSAALTALYFEADTELPLRAASRALPADASEETFAAARSTVLALVKPGLAHEVALESGGLPQHRAQGLVFNLPAEGRGVPTLVTLPMVDCWTMDVREVEFVAEQRRRLRVDLLFWRVVQGAAAAMLLLICGEVLMLGAGGYAAWLNKRLRDRTPEASSISDKNALAIGLDDFHQRAMHPFDMFRVLSRGRSQNVYFNSTTLEGLKMEIEGEATSMAEYNGYIANLKTAVELSGPPNEVETKIRDNITTFKIVVNFKPGVFAIAQNPTASTP